jgi:Chaperone of endosialidase
LNKKPRSLAPSSALLSVRRCFRASLFCAWALTAVTVYGISAPTIDSFSTKPDALLQIDLNRASVVDKIVESWKSEIPAAQISSFRSKLSALRADQLLAANVSGSFDTVLELVNKHEVALQSTLQTSLQTSRNSAQTAPQVLTNLNTGERNALVATDQSKALGDVSADLVYTPITPCRFVDTRGLFTPVYSGGAYTASQTRTYQTTGNCGIPTGAQGVVTQIIMINPTAAGDIELLPQGGTFGATAVMVFQANTYSSVSTVAKLNPTNGQFSTQIRGPGGNVAMDITGYFKAPGGVIGDITEIQTAAGSGLVGGTVSGVANIALAPTQLLPTTACAANQIPKWNGTAWACAADATSTGTAANAWLLGGNTVGTGANTIGTLDARPFNITAGDYISLKAQSAISLFALDASPLVETGVIYMTTSTNGGPNIRSGSVANTINANSHASTIGGGGENTVICFNPRAVTFGASCKNSITGGTLATISGGRGNVIETGFGPTIAGGANNWISGTGGSVISGGVNNAVNADNATVAGGVDNTAGSSITGEGQYSFVAGGNLNYTQGRASFAAGYKAKAYHDNSFVFGANSAGDTASAGASTLTGFFRNGYYLYGGSVVDKKCIYVPDSDNGWQCTSDRNAKTNIAKLNGRLILEKVMLMPVSSWSFKGGEGFKQIGPMAQDFFSAFKLGSDDKSISPMNMGGVALAAIQGLNQKLDAEVALSKAKDAKISALEKKAEKFEALERELTAIKKKLGL